MANAKNRLDGFAVALATWVIRLRWIVILAAIAGAVYVGQNAQKLEYSNNYRTFFSEDNPELKNFEEFQATYTKSDNFLFVFVPKDDTKVFTNRNLEAIGQLTEEAWRLPFATRVDSITNFQYTYAIGDELIVEDLVPEPGATSPQGLLDKEAAALAEPLLNGQLITSDASVTAVNVVLTYPEKSLTEVPEAVAAARALRAQIEEAYPDLEIYLTGTSMLNNAFGEAIQSDFKTLIPLMIGIIIVTTIIAVRSVSATFATLSLVILSTMFAMGWAGFVGIKLAGPSPSSVIVILTLAIADSIHILMSARSSMRAGMGQREAIIESIRINFLAVSITSLTTIVGFLSLNFSDSPPFHDFGNISAVGILAAWALSLTFLPAILSVVPLRVKTVDESDRGSFLRGFANFVIAHNKKLFVVMAAISAAAIAMIPTIELSDQFRKYFDPRIEFRSDTDAVIDYFGFYPMEFSVKAGEPGGVSDPAFLEKLEEFTEWLRAHPSVVHVYSVADIMKRLNKNLNEDKPEYYRLPEDRDLSAQYLLLFELSLPYGLDLNDRINIDKSSTRVTATLEGEISTKDIRQFLKDSDAWFDENAPEIEGPATGPQVMFTFIAQRNVESMVTGTSIAIVLIAFIMMAALRSLSMGLLSMVPNGLPILSAFGVWAILVGEVGFSVAAVASLSLGIVIDDTVHFLTKYMRARREKGLSAEDSIRYAFETVGAAIIFNTIILLAGFLVLTLSAFKINMELGMLTSLTIAIALVLDFLLLPGLLLMTARDRKGTKAVSQGESHATA
ncbi:MAG: MMPL family transporter [Pseudomonadota bacterium]